MHSSNVMNIVNTCIYFLASTGKLEVQEQVKEKEKEDTDPAAELFILEPVEQWKITLLIFSGSPDPVWTIQRQSQELFNAIKKLFSQAVKYEKVYKPSTVPLFLGFRGFFLQAGEEGPTFFITGSETKDLQVLLLRSIPEELVSKEVLDTVSEDIQKGKEIIMNEKLENSFTKRALNRRYDWFTKFIWNDDATRKRNNCYNYAVNTVTNTFAQPGRRRRNFNLELPLTGDIVMNAATVDGLRRPDVADGQPVASYAAVLGPNEYLVALVVHKS